MILDFENGKLQPEELAEIFPRTPCYHFATQRAYQQQLELPP
jgi:hypothetical protein